MKYIQYNETRPEDYDKVIDRIPLMLEKRKKHPEKYPTQLFPPHTIGGESKSFIIVEATSEQMMNVIAFWRPLMKINFVPIYPSDDIIQRMKDMR